MKDENKYFEIHKNAPNIKLLVGIYLSLLVVTVIVVSFQYDEESLIYSFIGIFLLVCLSVFIIFIYSRNKYVRSLMCNDKELIVTYHKSFWSKAIRTDQLPLQYLSLVIHPTISFGKECNVLHIYYKNRLFASIEEGALLSCDDFLEIIESCGSKNKKYEKDV